MLPRKSKLFFFCLLCFLIFQFIGCSTNESDKELVSASFIGGNQSVLLEVKLEVANTASERSMGLMYRDELKPNHGMIFIFPDEQVQSFWMKNTKIPLDIIFLDSQFRVVAIQHNSTPYSEDPRDSKGKLARYVVELIAGSCLKFGISEGVSLSLPNSDILPLAQ